CPVARIFTWVPPTSMTRTPVAMSRAPSLAGLREDGALGGDDVHQLVPGLDERLRALVLELGRERVDVDTGLGEPGQDLLAVATVGRQDLTELAVLGEGLQSAFGHGVDREGRGEGLDVQNVGGLRILGARAGPQEPLGTSTGIVGALPPRRSEESPARLVRALGYGDAELVPQRLGRLRRDRGIPAADEQRRDRADLRLEPRGHAALDAAHEGLRGRQVVLARE